LRHDFQKRHLAGFTIKPLLGVMFVLRALLPAASAGAIVGGQPDGNGHQNVGYLHVSPIGRPDGPTGVLTSPTVLLTADHVTRSAPGHGYDLVAGSDRGRLRLARA
jgi:hypothetical protein